MVKSHSKEDVELNMAAMLDMAFQLLTFFILTFKASPMEGQISLNMPPPQAVFNRGTEPVGDNDTKDPSLVQPVKTLLIGVASQDGDIDGIRLGIPGGKELETIDFPALQNKLAYYFRESAGAFEQVIIEGSPDLFYRELMKVVETCHKVQLDNGQKIAKLSFVSAVKEMD